MNTKTENLCRHHRRTIQGLRKLKSTYWDIRAYFFSNRRHEISAPDLAKHALVQMNDGTWNAIEILLPESVALMQTPQSLGDRRSSDPADIQVAKTQEKIAEEAVEEAGEEAAEKAG